MKIKIITSLLALSGALHTTIGITDIGGALYRDGLIRLEAFQNPEKRYIEQDRASYKQMMEESARAYGVPVQLIHAVALTESNMNPEAISPVGARGIMQVMHFWTKKCGLNSPQELFIAKNNIECGVYILSKNLKEAGNTADALCMYNSGRKCSDNSPAETKGYLVKVLKNLNLG